MYIFKNAWTSIVRNKGRNILIAIIIIAIAAACSVTLAILSAANKIVKENEEKYDVEATIGIDRSTLSSSLEEEDSMEDRIEAWNNIEGLTVEEIENYGDSEYLSSYYYVYSTSMNGEDLDEYTDSLVKETTTTETTTETNTFQIPSDGGGPGGMGGGDSYQTRKSTTKETTETEKIFNEKAETGTFTIQGYNSYASMSEFVDGTYRIYESSDEDDDTDYGSVFTDFDGDYCMISNELATLNDLEVGDTIELVNPYDDDLTYKLTIVGIYEEVSEDSSDMRNMFSSSANTILTTFKVVEKMQEDSDDLTITVTPTFILNSKDDVDAFAEEVKSKGLSEYYTVTNNVEEIESATKSINNVKSFASTFLIITFIIGAVVLLVLNMINIRERKYEIGVLRTIGMSRFKVISQFMIELLVVAFFALLIGAGIGSLVSKDVANSLLENEISNSTSETDKVNENFGGGKEDFDFTEGMNKNGQIEQYDSISAVVDFKVLLELLGIGLLLTMISSISASVAIARFSPLTILKERS